MSQPYDARQLDFQSMKEMSVSDKKNLLPEAYSTAPLGSQGMNLINPPTVPSSLGLPSGG